MNDTPGLRLRDLRESLGQSTFEVARSIGSRASYIEEIEEGKKMPSTRFLQALADHFMVSVDFFLTGEVSLPAKNVPSEDSYLAGFIYWLYAVSVCVGMALVVALGLSLFYAMTFLVVSAWGGTR